MTTVIPVANAGRPGEKMRAALGRIPEFKYCAVPVSKRGEMAPLASHGGGQARAETPV